MGTKLLPKSRIHKIKWYLILEKRISMRQQFKSYIKSQLTNTKEDEIDAILEIFELKHFKKDAYFKHPTNICKQLGFIVKGSFKHYAIKKNGSKIPGKVSQENSFVTDIISAKTKERTPIGIKALEASSVLVISIENMTKLLETNLTFNRLIREYMAQSIIKMGELHLLFITGSAKERYKFILENNPSLFKNTPLRFIASMIGITPTHLSRIRNKEDK